MFVLETLSLKLDFASLKMIGPLNNSIQSLNIQHHRRCTVCLVHNLEEDMLIALPRRVFLEWMGGFARAQVSFQICRSKKKESPK
jgi:hypothetical protein